MLRQLRNELTLTVTIRGLSPLLIKDGREGKEKGDKELPTMVFQSRLTQDELAQAVRQKNLAPICPKLFVPGSSLRGAWRSHLEKALRSLDDEPRVCDPFVGCDAEDEHPGRKAAEAERPDVSCSTRLANKEDAAPLHAYRDSCPICQLFGNTAQGSRIAFGEGEIAGGTPALIDNNAISRQTGAAISPFKSLVLLDAVVKTEIQLRNFELWQAGLMAHLFDDLANGVVRLGSGKSKGWGRVTAEVSMMELTYFGLENWFEKGKLLGVGEMLSDGDALRYGMVRNSAPPNLPGLTLNPASPIWRHTATINDAKSFWDLCRPLFNETTWGAVVPLSARRPAVAAPMEAGPQDGGVV